MNKKFFLLIVFVVAWRLGLGQPVTITPPSANIEPGGSVTLTASGAMYYQWSPATGLSVTEGPVTVASPAVTTTYTCEGYAPGAESVVNGDFSQGNFGFTSAYEYNTNVWGEGTYCVDYDASLHHQDFVGHGHGGATDNFMIVNGAIVPGTNVWTEQITVNPNKWYAFSTWVCTLAGYADQVALLQFSINNEQIGEIFSAPVPQNTWEQFYELWYSGDNTSATITILNQNTGGSGNDFGLDDISFRELVLVGAPTCTVTIGSMTATATADDTELCEDETTTLHALPANGSGNYTFSWSPAGTLSDPNVQHPVASPPVGTTTYTCLINDVGWGTSENVSVTLLVHPKEEEHFYETICAEGSYNFYGTPVSVPGLYEHHVQTQFGCDKTIYLHLENWPANDTTVITPTICTYQTYNFHGTEYSEDGQIAYFDTIGEHGCLKVEKLILTVEEYQVQPIEEEYVCYVHGETPYFKWDKNNQEYHADTYDEAIVPDPDGGCDFKYRLSLKFHEEYYEEEPPVVRCNEYIWPATGEVFTETNHHVVRTFQHTFGDKECDSTYVLDITIHTAPETEGIRCMSANSVVFGDTVAVVTNTEFFSFQYDFAIEVTNPESGWDSCIWAISKPSWAIEFDTVPKSIDNQWQSRCKVYVADRQEEYVILTSTLKNGCGTTERSFYLKSSFLGLDECQRSGFSVVPNPNNGEMTLRFEGFSGKVSVKVYDMTGHLVDRFETRQETEGQTMPYTLQGYASGVYFFVVTGKEGALAKKVIIRR